MKTKIIILFFILFVILNSSRELGTIVYAQPVTQEWVAWFDDPNHLSDISYGMVVDRNGNVYVTGNTGTTNNRYQITTIKYSPSGVQQWVGIYDDINVPYNIPNGISIDSTGFIYVYGISGDQFSSIYHTVLIKYNQNGDSLWVRKYYGDGANYNSPASIGNDSQGNIYLTGGGDYNNLFLIKYNSNGDTLWSKLYNRPGYNGSYGSSIALDTGGNIYVGGSCWESSPPPDRPDFLVVKYNPSGSLLWSVVDSLRLTFEGINKIALDRQANVFATGYAADNNGNNVNYMTVKWSSTGIFQWERRYFQGYSDEAYDVVTDNLGNAYVTGLNSTPGYDYATIKYNSSGDSLWVKRFGYHGGFTTGSNRMVIDNYSDIYVVGGGEDSSNNYILSTIKYNTNGIQQWLVNKIADVFSSSQYNIFVDKNFNVYSCSSAAQSGSNLDYLTIKYSQPNGIINNNTFANKFELTKNYPNPFNPSTVILYEIGTRSSIKMAVFDLLGRKVYEFPIQEKDAGYYIEHWDGTNFASGVYFYKLTANYKENNIEKEFSKTIKILLIK